MQLKFVVICFQNFVLISICVVFWAVARTCQALQMPLTIKDCVEVEIL
jgi:type IV secretory pathway VirB3-like protein